MGLVSNGGQGLALVVAGASGAYAEWGWPAQTMMWGTALFISSIAVAICVAFSRSAPTRSVPSTQ